MKRSTVLIVPLLAFSSLSMAEIQSPYKIIEDQLVFQEYTNYEPVILKNASVDSFDLIYKSEDFSVAYSNDHLYCNGTSLPNDFDVSNASVYGGFLISENYSYARCKKMDKNINPEKMETLEFPFYKDDKSVFTISGNILPNANPANIQTSRNQAYDDKNYYFTLMDTITVPYTKTVELLSCMYWAEIDGNLYYKGVKQNDIDAKTFRCIDTYTVLDSKNIYSSGKKSFTFSTPIDVNKLKLIGDNFLTDGKSVWYTQIEPIELTDIDPNKATINNNSITDGKTTWQCETYKTNDDPICTKIE